MLKQKMEVEVGWLSKGGVGEVCGGLARWRWSGTRTGKWSVTFRFAGLVPVRQEGPDREWATWPLRACLARLVLAHFYQVLNIKKTYVQ